MTRRWQAAIGILCGIAIWLAASSLFGPPAIAPPRPSGAILSECDGSLDQLVIHYLPDATFAESLYLNLLPQLPSDVTVNVACADLDAFERLRRKLGNVPCKLRPIISRHPITTWSRDRWIALRNSAGQTTLVAPAEEEASEQWPARHGDAQIAFTLAGALSPSIQAWRSPLLFDGGDLLADSTTVFATPALSLRNLQHTVATRDELVDELNRTLGRRLVFLENVPEHHAGMFMMAAGDNVMLVGDPGLAKPLWDAQHLWPDGIDPATWQPDFSTETQHKFDNAAAQASAAGYRIVRIPTVPGHQSKAYLTYVNVLIDRRPGHKTVYLPTYRGAESLNAIAHKTWQSLGYEVHEIDCTDVFPNFGTLHCLVNVLRRSNG